MADEMKMNFKALKRVDPYIEKIEDFATQVALYKYASSEWEKLDIEGTFFVNRRQDDPKYGFIILNRLSDKNLVEPVTKELDFQVHTPFLLYKNKEGSIFGIWFFDPKECERIHKKMESYVKIVEKRLQGDTIKNQNGDDSIIALLQKASMEDKPEGEEEELTRQQSPSSSSSPKLKEDGDKLLQLLNNGPAKVSTLEEPKKEAKKKEDSPPSTVNSVADFFAKASKNGSAFSTPLLTSSAAGPLANTFSPAGVLHPLMPMAPGPVSIIPLQSFHGLGGPPGPHHPVHVPVALHQSWQTDNHQSSNAPPPTENATTQRLFSIPGSFPLELIERSHRGDNSGASTPPHFQPITPGKGGLAQQKHSKTLKPGSEPELMSPMAFAHNPAKISKASATNDNSINGIHLNEGQLVLAMKHLLANDSTFVTKLHKAYLEAAKSQ